MNEYFIKLLGYDDIDDLRSNIITATQIYMNPSDRNLLLKEIARTPQGFYSQEAQFVRKDGSVIWALNGGYANKENDVLEGFIIDVTEKRTYQAELERSENLYRITIENSRDWIYVTDATDDFNVLLANKAFIDSQRWLNAPIDVVGKPLTHTRVHCADYIKSLHEEVRRTKRPKYIMSFDGMVEGQGEGQYIIDVTKVPIFDGAGNVVAILTSLHNQTEQAELERTLEKQRNEFMALYKNAPLGLFRINKETCIVEYANGQLATMLGYPNIDTCCRCSLKDHINDLDKILTPTMINKEHTVQIIRCDGLVIWVSFKVVLDESQTYYDGYILDVTEYKRIREHLFDQTTLYRTVFNAMKDWIMVLDRNLIVLLSNTTNDEFARPGSGRNTCVGVHVTEAYPALSQEALQEYKQVIETKKDLVAERKEHNPQEHSCTYACSRHTMH